MAKPTVKVNDRALQGLFEGIAAKIDKFDRDFRATHEGYPVEVVEADVSAAFPGLDMSNTMRHNYAVAVSERKTYRFKLTG